MKQILLILSTCCLLYAHSDRVAQQTNPLVMGYRYTDPYRMIQEGALLLKEGDLVVRLNRDPLSSFIKNFNRRDKSYSHAGIVLYEKGYPYIFHIVKGEENPDGKLRKDSLRQF